MAIEQDIIELINADIDGELAEAERATLQDYLQAHPDAQAYYDELANMCASLDSVQQLDPPPHLRHQILHAVTKPPAQKARQEEAPFWRSFLLAPPLHYVGTFAAGSLVTFLIISSNQISDRAFDDVTDLVGTMTTDVNSTGGPEYGTINLAAQVLAGTVKAHRAGPIMVIDFDLSASKPVEIIAEFTDPDVWFNGFAQLESDGTSVSAKTGRVSLQMTGKRRYAMYLHNASNSAATVSLRFYAAGELVHEGSLTFGSTE